MQGKSFSARYLTPGPREALRPSCTGLQCRITSVSNRRPLKDLFIFYFSLWNIITLLRDYWTIHNEDDYFQRLDTMDKEKVKTQMRSSAAVTRGTG